LIALGLAGLPVLVHDNGHSPASKAGFADSGSGSSGTSGSNSGPGSLNSAPGQPEQRPRESQQRSGHRAGHYDPRHHNPGHCRQFAR